jgi:hypothetical protein
MEKERVVVNDTNVFIDLYSIGLLEEFFSLPWEVHTTNLVMLELKRPWHSLRIQTVSCPWYPNPSPGRR